MKKFTKIFRPVLAITLVFSLCLLTSCSLFGQDSIDPKKEAKSHQSFINELGGVSDTYVGAVSKSTYSTNETAVQAYVDDQIAGNDYCSIVETTSAGELTAEQIAELKLSDADAAGVLAVEALDVTVSGDFNLADNQKAGIMLLANLDTTKTVKVYVIKYAEGFKYYTPCPVTGETVTKSYYDSVFNSDKYKNCTYTTTTTIKEKISLIGFLKINVNIVTTQKICFTENAIYIEQITKASKLLNQDSQNYAYLIEDEYGSMKCYVSTDKENWNPGSLSTVGFNSIDELTPFHDQYLDYTYFTKTDYGFELANENAKQYLDQALSVLDTTQMEDFEIDMFSKYYVCEGTLSGMRMEMYMDFAMQTETEEQSVNVGASALIEMKITDCGTTTVELPFEVES